jgi:hypothetical protein
VVDRRAAFDTWLVEVGTEEVEAVPHTSLAVVVDTGAEVDILTPPDKRQADILEELAIERQPTGRRTVTSRRRTSEWPLFIEQRKQFRCTQSIEPDCSTPGNKPGKTPEQRVTNQIVVRRNNSRINSFAETRKIIHQNNGERLKSRALIMNRTGSFDRSITRPRAQVLMDQRLSQISSRRWTGHGQVGSGHFDRDHGFRFRHGGYWWRCNFWGAHSYCNHLIAIGFSPGLCWGWYDDICWGNIVVGMPIDLIGYYYPDQVYTTYTTYDGDEATV